MPPRPELRLVERADSVGELVDQLLADDGAYRAEGALLQARGELGSWAAVAERVGAELVELGRRWERGTITILQEHLASSRLGRALGHLAASVRVAPGAPRALLVAGPGDEHTLGLALVELCLLEAGWHCRWAGRATPAQEVVAHIESHELEMVLASASEHSSDADALARWARTVGDACRRASAELVLGGNGAWPTDPDHGVRLRDFQQLTAFLAGLKARLRR